MMIMWRWVRRTEGSDLEDDVVVDPRDRIIFTSSEMNENLMAELDAVDDCALQEVASQLSR